MALQNIIKTSARASVASAETHRLSAISNIENALRDQNAFAPEQVARLERLVRSLYALEGETPERKLSVVQDTVIPTLIAMGLVENEDYRI